MDLAGVGRGDGKGAAGWGKVVAAQRVPDRAGSSGSVFAHRASGSRQPSSQTRRFRVFSPAVLTTPQIWAVGSLSLRAYWDRLLYQPAGPLTRM
jgi:hypothetical protein